MNKDNNNGSSNAPIAFNVSARQFSDYLSRKNPNGFICSVCGSSSWVPGSFSEENKPAMMLPVFSQFSRADIFSRPPDYIDAALEMVVNAYFTLTCQTCHNTLFFSAARVAIDIREEMGKGTSNSPEGGNG